MNNKLVHTLVAILTVLLTLPAFAKQAPKLGFMLKPAFNVHCSDLTGTWQGSFVDPTDLVGNGGPWPISVELYSKGKGVIGKIEAKHAPDAVKRLVRGKFWAQCKQGNLSRIYIQRPSECGHVTNKGVLASRNLLIFYLPYENAMTGTDFLVTLTRSSDKYPGQIPRDNSTIVMPKVVTCH